MTHKFTGTRPALYGHKKIEIVVKNSSFDTRNWQVNGSHYASAESNRHTLSKFIFACSSPFCSLCENTHQTGGIVPAEITGMAHSLSFHYVTSKIVLV